MRVGTLNLTARPDPFAPLGLDAVPALDAAGVLVAADGFLESDGERLRDLRAAVGGGVPVVAVVGRDANPSPAFLAAVDAITTYAAEAADLLSRTLRGEVRPAMSAVTLPMAVPVSARGSDAMRAIEAFAEEQRAMPLLLSNAVLFGNPNVDGPHLGATAVVVTDNDAAFARNLADDLANAIWEARGALGGTLPAYRQRPRPLWPFESDASWQPRGEFR